MGNLTEKLVSDTATHCNELNHYKSQNYTSTSSITKTSKKDLVIFHQNIRGLSITKLDELLVSLSINTPHIICLTEHHLSTNEIDTTVLTNHRLGAHFCRNTYKNGGVRIFISEIIQSTTINLDKFCKEKDFEICAAKLHLLSGEICIVTIYRSPSGDFQYFTDNLEKILSMIYSNNTEIIICGDFNVNYLTDLTHKQLLDLLLASYDLSSTVQFPIRIQNNSYSAMTISLSILSNFMISVSPIINRLSDHDAQNIIICNLLDRNCNTQISFKRRIDVFSIKDFHIKLSYESWEDIFTEDDVNTIFNNFLNTYLRIFYYSFPLKKSIINPLTRHG